MSVVTESRYVALTGRDLTERTGALLDAAEDLIEEQLRRKLASATHTQTLPVRFLARHGRYGCFPQHTPVTSVTTPATAQNIDGTVVLLPAGESWLGSEVVNGWDVDDDYPASHFVSLTYVGGYTAQTLPVTLALAICKLAAAMEDTGEGGIPAGAKSVTLEGASVVFDTAVSYADSLAPGLSQALRPYRYRGSVAA